MMLSAAANEQLCRRNAQGMKTAVRHGVVGEEEEAVAEAGKSKLDR